jgi:hypothetical protein
MYVLFYADRFAKIGIDAFIALTNVLQVASKASLALSGMESRERVHFWICCRGVDSLMVPLDAGRHDLAARVVACAAGVSVALYCHLIIFGALTADTSTKSGCVSLRETSRRARMQRWVCPRIEQ